MSRFSELPEPVRLEDMVTTADAHEAEPDTEQAFDVWLLRHAAG